MANGDVVDLDSLRSSISVPIEARTGELRFVLPEGSAQVPTVLNALVAVGLPLDGMRVESPNLETVFLALTGKALRDHGANGGAS